MCRLTLHNPLAATEYVNSIYNYYHRVEPETQVSAEYMTSQTDINDHLALEFSKIFTRWGVECIRMELRNLKPNSSQQIAVSMKKQMVAERHRRGQFILAEGEKTAMRLEAEGNKVRMQNLGIANQEATRKRSEGEKEAKIEIAQSEARALGFIGETLAQEPGNPSQADYMMSQRYLETFQAVFG